MYCYKINNSYTIYVNYEFLNECIKANKKNKTFSSLKTSNASKKQNKPIDKKDPFIPLPINSKLYHKVWGNGTVISTDEKGIMTVAFRTKTARFIYPDAIKQGFLVLA